MSAAEQLTQDISAILSDETRDWVARNGAQVRQVGNLIFVVMIREADPPPAQPKPQTELPVDSTPRTPATAMNIAAAMESLSGGSARTVEQVAKDMGVSLSTARRVLALLMAKGLVRRMAAEGEQLMRWSYYRP